jgi:hypothetical protein
LSSVDGAGMLLTLLVSLGELSEGGTQRERAGK